MPEPNPNINSPENNISGSKDKPITKLVDNDLIKAEHYELVKRLGNGFNIKEASRRTGIAFATLWDELRIWEFAGLVKMHDRVENGRAVKIIETIREEKKDDKKEKN